MWNAPTQEQLSQIPTLYETEHIPLQDKIIHLHMFIGGSDFFIAECDEEGETCFGFNLLHAPRDAEWGYMNLPEMKRVNIGGIQIDNDIFWTPCPSSEIRTICNAMGWPLIQPNKLMSNMTA